MDEVADVLRRRLRARPRLLGGVGLAWISALAIGGVAAAVATGGPDALTQCRTARQAPPPSWPADRGVVAAELPVITGELDTWAAQWEDARVQACHEPDAPTRTAIDDCLDRSQARFGQLTTWLAGADEGVWSALITHPGPRPLAGLIDTLPDPGQCVQTPLADDADAPWEHLLAMHVALRGSDLVTARSQAERTLRDARSTGNRRVAVAAKYGLQQLDALEGKPQPRLQALRLVLEAISAGLEGLAADSVAMPLVASTGGQALVDLAPDATPLDLRAEELAAELDGLGHGEELVDVRRSGFRPGLVAIRRGQGPAPAARS